MFDKQYKHKIPIQIRFNDVDRVNHVNNALYHTYIELGRVHYLNEVLKREVDWNEKGFVLARTEIDYKIPIYLRDEVFCFTKMTALGNKSLTIQSSIAKIVNGALAECAVAKGTLVAMDYSVNKSIEVPAAWRELFEMFEKD
jgi:acyl-CoA thioester hydrolase